MMVIQNNVQLLSLDNGSVLFTLARLFSTVGISLISIYLSCCVPAWTDYIQQIQHPKRKSYILYLASGGPFLNHFVSWCELVSNSCEDVYKEENSIHVVVLFVLLDLYILPSSKQAQLFLSWASVSFFAL